MLLQEQACKGSASNALLSQDVHDFETYDAKQQSRMQLSDW